MKQGLTERNPLWPESPAAEAEARFPAPPPTHSGQGCLLPLEGGAGGGEGLGDAQRHVGCWALGSKAKTNPIDT